VVPTLVNGRAARDTSVGTGTLVPRLDLPPSRQARLPEITIFPYSGTK
jgi:hypothetical protein